MEGAKEPEIMKRDAVGRVSYMDHSKRLISL